MCVQYNWKGNVDTFARFHGVRKPMRLVASQFPLHRYANTCITVCILKCMANAAVHINVVIFFVALLLSKG